MTKRTLNKSGFSEEWFNFEKPWTADLGLTTSDIVAEVMKKSVITPDFESKKHIANSNKSTRRLKLERKVIVHVICLGLACLRLSILNWSYDLRHKSLNVQIFLKEFLSIRTIESIKVFGF